MSGICSGHKHHEPGCPRCEADGVMESEEKKCAEIARRDWEREIYKQCDEEDRLENEEAVKEE